MITYNIVYFSGAKLISAFAISNAIPSIVINQPNVAAEATIIIIIEVVLADSSKMCGSSFILISL